MRSLVTVACVFLCLTAGCTGFLGSEGTPAPTDEPGATTADAEAPTAPTATATPTPEPTATATPESTARATPTPEPTATPTATPEPTPTPTSESTPVPDNPWNERTVEVTFHDQTDSSRNFESPVRTALEYWNGRTTKYTSYNVTFRFRPNLSTSEADMVVVASKPIEFCGGPVDHDFTTAGCYRNEHRIDIYDNQTNLEFRTTTIHELGHALHLGHNDEPTWAMSTAGVEYEGSIPNASERDNPWNTTGPLKLGVGPDLDNKGQYRQELRDVAEYYNAHGQYTPGDMQVVVVDDWYEAHVLVKDSSKTDYQFDGPGSIAYTRGLNYDSDSSFEQWQVAEVYFHRLNWDDTERHAGYWTGRLLGNSESELPNRYR